MTKVIPHYFKCRISHFTPLPEWRAGAEIPDIRVDPGHSGDQEMRRGGGETPRTRQTIDAAFGVNLRWAKKVSSSFLSILCTV